MMDVEGGDVGGANEGQLDPLFYQLDSKAFGRGFRRTFVGGLLIVRRMKQHGAVKKEKKLKVPVVIRL